VGGGLLARIFSAGRNVGWAVILATWRPLLFGGCPEGEADKDDDRYDKPAQQAVAHFFAFSPSSTRRRVASESVGISG
jgi:hypothetical protein